MIFLLSINQTQWSLSQVQSTLQTGSRLYYQLYLEGKLSDTIELVDENVPCNFFDFTLAISMFCDIL